MKNLHDCPKCDGQLEINPYGYQPFVGNLWECDSCPHSEMISNLD